MSASDPRTPVMDNRTLIPGVVVSTQDYRGRTFDRFEVRRDPGHAPGWFIFGRNPQYGDRLVMLVARPDVAPRRTQGYNGAVRRGWHTKRAALLVVALLAPFAPVQRCTSLSGGPLCGDATTCDCAREREARS